MINFSWKSFESAVKLAVSKYKDQKNAVARFYQKRIRKMTGDVQLHGFAKELVNFGVMLRQDKLMENLRTDFSHLKADKDDLELVYEAVINKPSLMNVGQLHDTYNPDLENSRWTLSFTLLNMDGSHCTFKQATEIFKASINA